MSTKLLIDSIPFDRMRSFSKNDLIKQIFYYSGSLNRLKKQYKELRKENERLRAELGFDKTQPMRFKA